MGVIDLLVGMYYEVESRRLKNEISENIVYGWQEQPAQLTFEPTPESDVSDLQDIYDNMSNQLPFGSELQELPFDMNEQEITNYVLSLIPRKKKIGFSSRSIVL